VLGFNFGAVDVAECVGWTSDKSSSSDSVPGASMKIMEINLSPGTKGVRTEIHIYCLVVDSCIVLSLSLFII
jgi:hypothetical protein